MLARGSLSGSLPGPTRILQCILGNNLPLGKVPRVHGSLLFGYLDKGHFDRYRLQHNTPRPDISRFSKIINQYTTTNFLLSLRCLDTVALHLYWDHPLRSEGIAPSEWSPSKLRISKSPRSRISINTMEINQRNPFYVSSLGDGFSDTNRR
jgi:hypothetical protein